MAQPKLKTASVLAFERKLSNSDALMHSGNWDDKGTAANWQPICILSKDVRGTISNRLKTAITSDPAKLDAEIQKANLQRVEVAALPFEADSLKVNFTLRVLGDLATPSACNNPDYQAKLAATIESYIKQNHFEELAKRYSENLANGRFLWRNRVGAEAVAVIVTHIVDQKEQNQWTFNSRDYNLRDFG